MARMESLALFTSASGRIAPKPFWLGVVAVYVASFLSQFLLAAPVTARASVLPFLVAQAAIAWAWYALHARRLRDAGRADRIGGGADGALRACDRAAAAWW